MKTIEIDGKSYLIDIEKVKKLGLLKEPDNRPRSWSEYCNNAGRDMYDKFSSHEESKAFVALRKLIQLRDAWWGDWKPDWNNGKKKYYMHVYDTNVCIDDSNYIQHTFTFPTEEMANDFLKTFRDMIEQAKMFL